MELWEFRPDGMGSIQILGPFLHPREETLYFEWKENAGFSLLVKRLYWVKAVFDDLSDCPLPNPRNHLKVES